jgi:hypothetical protein
MLRRQATGRKRNSSFEIDMQTGCLRFIARLKRFSLPAVIIASMWLTACSAGTSAVTTPGFTFLGISLSKAVKKRGDIAVPVEPATTFSINDKEAIALLAVKNLHHQIRLRWEWYSPDGALYYSTGNVPVAVSEKKYIRQFTAWHAMTIQGDKAGTMPGPWTVKVFMDDEYLEMKRFDILEGDS